MAQVVKVIEVVGLSDQGWEDAARKAVEGASQSVHGISGIEVISQTADVKDGKITGYKTTVKLAFLVDQKS